MSDLASTAVTTTTTTPAAMATPDIDSTVVVSDKTILLFGRGRSEQQERRTNGRFIQFVNDYRERYETQSLSSIQRNGIIKRIIDELQMDGYTFLKPSSSSPSLSSSEEVTSQKGDDVVEQMKDTNGSWVPASPTEVHDNVSRLFRSRRTTRTKSNNTVTSSSSSSSSSSGDESGGDVDVTTPPSSTPLIVTNQKKRPTYEDPSVSSSEEKYTMEPPTKVPRLVSDEQESTTKDVSCRWGSTTSSGAVCNSMYNSVMPNLMEGGETSRISTTAIQDLNGMLFMGGTAIGGDGDGGLDAYNQLPMVVPTPTDDLSVDDLSRPRTIGYIKQPFQPSTPNIVIYRPVILLPKGMSSPSSIPSSKFTGLAPPTISIMTNNINNNSNIHSLKGMNSSLYQQSLSLLQRQQLPHNHHQQQQQLQSMMKATLPSSPVSIMSGDHGATTTTTTNAWLKSDFVYRKSSYDAPSGNVLFSSVAATAPNAPQVTHLPYKKW